MRFGEVGRNTGKPVEIQEYKMISILVIWYFDRCVYIYIYYKLYTLDTWYYL